MKLVKFTEVFETTNKHAKNMSKKYSLREVFINPDHVVCVRTDPSFRRHLTEGIMPEGIDGRQEFSRIYLNRGQVGLDVVVVGDPILVERRLNLVNDAKSTLIKG